MSKLQINEDKTNLMCLNNPRHKEQSKTINIKTEKYTIKPKEKLRYLGWIVYQRCDYTDQINYKSSQNTK